MRNAPNRCLPFPNFLLSLLHEGPTTLSVVRDVMLFVFNSRLSSNCSDVTVDFGNLSASSISVRSNVIVSSDGVFLHFIF